MTSLQITTSVILLIQQNLTPKIPPGGGGVPMTTKQGSYQLQAPQSSTSPVKSLRLLAKAEPEDTLALTLREKRRPRNRSHPSGCQQIPSLLMRRLTLNSRAVGQHVVGGSHLRMPTRTPESG